MFGFGRSSSKRDRSPDDGRHRKRDSVSRSSRKADSEVAASSTPSRRRSQRDERKSSDKISSDGKKSRRKRRGDDDDDDSDSDSPPASSSRRPQEPTTPSTTRYEDTQAGRSEDPDPKRTGRSKRSVDASGDKSTCSSTKKSPRSLDQPRSLGEPQQSSTSNRIANQFPDQTPLNYSTSRLPGQQSYGEAAEYYGDQGQSVANQPGVRPGTPVIVGAEPHLQPASAEPRPPQETGHGAAAEFYAGEDYSQDTSYTAAVQASSQSASNQTASTGRPPSGQQGSGAYKWAASAMAAGAAGLAANVLSGQHHNSSQRPPAGQGRPSSSRPPITQASISTSRPSKTQSSPSASRPSMAQSSPSASRPPAHTHVGSVGAAELHHHQHGPQGPLDKLVDWWNDYEDVAKMEAYTEYLGICKHCFDPRSSPADAPRIHRPRRTRSRESLDGVRVDKDRRFRATDSSKRRQKRDASWLGASLAGLGLAGAARAVDGDLSEPDERPGLAVSRNAGPSQSVAWPQTPGNRVDTDSGSRRTSATSTLRTSAGRDQPLAQNRANSVPVRTPVKERAADPRSDRSPLSSVQSQRPPPGVAEERPVTIQRRQSFSSESEQEQGVFSRFFGTPKKKTRRPSPRSGAIYSHSNSSSSSIDSSLAFGPGRRRPTTTSKRPSTKRRSSSDAARNALLGLGAAAAALAAHDARRGQRSTAGNGVMSGERPRLGNQGREIRQTRQGPAYPGSDEEAWESASNDSQASSAEHHGLAFSEDDGGNGIVMTDVEAEESVDGDHWQAPPAAHPEKILRRSRESSAFVESPTEIQSEGPVFRPSDVEISAPQSRRPFDTRRLPDLDVAPQPREGSSPITQDETPKKLSRASTFPLSRDTKPEPIEKPKASPSSRKAKKNVGFTAAAAAATAAATVAAVSSRSSSKKEPPQISRTPEKSSRDIRQTYEPDAAAPAVSSRSSTKRESPRTSRTPEKSSRQIRQTYESDEERELSKRQESDRSDRPESPPSPVRYSTQVRRPRPVDHDGASSQENSVHNVSIQSPEDDLRATKDDPHGVSESDYPMGESLPNRSVPQIIEPRSPSPIQQSPVAWGIPRINIIEPSRTPTPEPRVADAPSIPIDRPDSPSESEKFASKADGSKVGGPDGTPTSDTFRPASYAPSTDSTDFPSTSVRSDRDVEDSDHEQRSFATEIRRPSRRATDEDTEPLRDPTSPDEAQRNEPQAPAHSDDFGSWEADRASFRSWTRGKRADSEQDSKSPNGDAVDQRSATIPSQRREVSTRDDRPLPRSEQYSGHASEAADVQQPREEKIGASSERPSPSPFSGGSTKFAGFVSALQRSAKPESLPRQSQRQVPGPPQKPGSEQLFKFPTYNGDPDQQPDARQEVALGAAETGREPSGEPPEASLSWPRPSSPVHAGDQASDRYAPPPSESRLSSPIEANDPTPDATPARGPRPSRAPSSTSIPLRFRPPKFSPASNRDSFVQSPNGSESSPTRTPVRPRSARPSSTEFKSSTDFRPLYLVERNSKILEPEASLPSLPSSRSTSRSPSVQDSEDAYESAVESPEHRPTASDVPLPESPDLQRMHEESDFLDSGQTTPKAGRTSPSPPRPRVSDAISASDRSVTSEGTRAPRSQGHDFDKVQEALLPALGVGFAALSQLPRPDSKESSDAKASRNLPSSQDGAEEVLEPVDSRSSKAKKKRQAKKAKRLSLASEEPASDEKPSRSLAMQPRVDESQDLAASSTFDQSTAEQQPSEVVELEQDSSDGLQRNQQMADSPSMAMPMLMDQADASAQDDNATVPSAESAGDISSREMESTSSQQAEQAEDTTKKSKKDRRKSKRLSWAEPLSAPDTLPQEPDMESSIAPELTPSSFDDSALRLEDEAAPSEATEDSSRSSKATKKDKKKSKKANKTAFGWSSIFSAVAGASAAKIAAPAETSKSTSRSTEARAVKKDIEDAESVNSPEIDSGRRDDDHAFDSPETQILDESDPPLTATRETFPAIEKGSPNEMEPARESSKARTNDLSDPRVDEETAEAALASLPSSVRLMRAEASSGRQTGEDSSDGIASTNESGTVRVRDLDAPFAGEESSQPGELDLEPTAGGETYPSPVHPQGLLTLPNASEDAPVEKRNEVQDDALPNPTHPATLVQLPNNLNNGSRVVNPEVTAHEDNALAPTHPGNILSLPNALEQDPVATESPPSMHRGADIVPTAPQRLASLADKHDSDSRQIYMDSSEDVEETPAPTHPKHLLKLPNAVDDDIPSSGPVDLAEKSSRDSSSDPDVARVASSDSSIHQSGDVRKVSAEASFDDVVTATMAAAGFSTALLSSMSSPKKTRQPSPARSGNEVVARSPRQPASPRAQSPESPVSPKQSSLNKGGKQDTGFDEIVAAAMATAGFHEGLLSRRSSPDASSMVSAREDPEFHDLDQDVYATPRAGSPSYAWTNNDSAVVDKDDQLRDADNQSRGQAVQEALADTSLSAPDDEWSSTISRKMKKKGKKGKTYETDESVQSSENAATMQETDPPFTASPQDASSAADEPMSRDEGDTSRQISAVGESGLPNEPSTASAETETDPQDFGTSKKKKQKRKSSSKTTSLLQFFSGSSSKKGKSKSKASPSSTTTSQAAEDADAEVETRPVEQEAQDATKDIESSENPQDTSSKGELPPELTETQTVLDPRSMEMDIDEPMLPASTTPADAELDNRETPTGWDIPMSSKDKKKNKKAEKAKRASMKSDEQARDAVDTVAMGANNESNTHPKRDTSIDDEFNEAVYDEQRQDGVVDREIGDSQSHEHSDDAKANLNIADDTLVIDRSLNEAGRDDFATDKATADSNEKGAEKTRPIISDERVQASLDDDSYGGAAANQADDPAWEAPMSSKERKKLKTVQKAAKTRETSMDVQEPTPGPSEDILPPADEVIDDRAAKDEAPIARFAAPDEDEWAVPVSISKGKKSKKAKRASKALDADISTGSATPDRSETAATSTEVPDVMTGADAAEKEPSEPNAQADPAQFGESSQKAAPIEPVELTEPVEQSKSVEPAESAKPIQPIELTEPVESVERDAPAEPIQPIELTEPTDPFERGEPAEPVSQAERTQSTVAPDEDEWAAPMSSKEKKKAKKAKRASKTFEAKDEPETDKLPSTLLETAPLVAEAARDIAKEDDFHTTPSAAPEDEWAAPMSSKDKKKAKKAQKARQSMDVAESEPAIPRDSVEPASAIEPLGASDPVGLTGTADFVDPVDVSGRVGSNDAAVSLETPRATESAEPIDTSAAAELKDTPDPAESTEPMDSVEPTSLPAEAIGGEAEQDEPKEVFMAAAEDEWAAPMSSKQKKKAKKAQKARQSRDDVDAEPADTMDDAKTAGKIDSVEPTSLPADAIGDSAARDEPQESSTAIVEDDWAAPMSSKQKKKAKKAQKARKDQEDLDIEPTAAPESVEPTPLPAETIRDVAEQDKTKEASAPIADDEWAAPLSSKVKKKAKKAQKARKDEDDDDAKPIENFDSIEPTSLPAEAIGGITEPDETREAPAPAVEEEWAAPMSSKDKKKAKKAQKARQSRDDTVLEPTGPTESVEPTPLPAEEIGDVAEQDEKARSAATAGDERAIPSSSKGDDVKEKRARFLDDVTAEPLETTTVAPLDIDDIALDKNETDAAPATMPEDDEWAVPMSSKEKKKKKKAQKASKNVDETTAEKTSVDAGGFVAGAAAVSALAVGMADRDSREKAEEEERPAPSASRQLAHEKDDFEEQASSKKGKKNKKKKGGLSLSWEDEADSSAQQSSNDQEPPLPEKKLEQTPDTFKTSGDVGEPESEAADGTVQARVEDRDTPSGKKSPASEHVNDLVREEDHALEKSVRFEDYETPGRAVPVDNNAITDPLSSALESNVSTGSARLPQQQNAEQIVEDWREVGSDVQDYIGPVDAHDTRGGQLADEDEDEQQANGRHGRTYSFGAQNKEYRPQYSDSEKPLAGEEDEEEEQEERLAAEVRAALPREASQSPREHTPSSEAWHHRGRSLEAIPETSQEAPLLQSLVEQEEGMAEGMEEGTIDSPPASRGGLTRSAIGKLDEEEASIGLPDRPLHPDESRSNVSSRREEGSEVTANIRRAYIRSPGQEQREAIIRPRSAQSSHSRAASATSNQSSSLRRVDRSVSSDLRAANKRDAAGLAASGKAPPATSLSHGPDPPPNYEPLKGTGKDRRQDMSDTGVFEAWGDARGSPRSPTKPPSIRKRQSTHILELEAQLDEVKAENRALHDARSRQPPAYGSPDPSSSLQKTLQSREIELHDKDVEIESIRSSLTTLNAEIARLSEHNEQLQQANDNLSADVNGRYATLQSERDHAHAEWQTSSRQLTDLTERHEHLSSGMEAIVQEQIGAALAEKNAEIKGLRAELDDATDRIVALQQQIRAAGPQDDFLNVRDEDYFDSACQQLCQHVQQWVLRFSKFSDTKACRLSSQLDDEATETRLDNAILDGSDVDVYLGDRVRRRDVFMSIVMTMIWEFIFTRYLFGMDREQRQKLKSLEKTLGEVGPQRAVSQWRATTLTLLSRREAFQEQRAQDTEAVCQEIYGTLERLLPPPQRLAQQIRDSLRNVLSLAVDISIEMRTQRPEYVMLPPLQPEYDTNGDLARKVYFNAALMNERSGETASNEELEERSEVVRVVLFPLVVKKGNDAGETDEEVVVCPAQVLVARPDLDRARLAGGGPMGKSVQSLAPTAPYDASSMV